MWQDAEKYLLKDKYVGFLIKKYGHCTIKPRNNTDFFESLIGEIIGQQLSGKVANVIESRLKAKIKGRLTAEKILFLQDDDIRNCGMAWSKVRAIKDLSQKVKSGELRMKNLKELSDSEVKRDLVTVKGIGPWTADMFLIFSLGRPDTFPVEDSGIQRGFEKLIGQNFDKIKSALFAEKHWKPYRSVASWYLWKFLDN